jgi:hypothetical protein
MPSRILPSFVIGSLLLISSPSQAALLTYDVDPLSSGASGTVDVSMTIGVFDYMGFVTLGYVELSDNQPFGFLFSGSVELDSGLPDALDLALDGMLLNSLDLVAVASPPGTPLVTLSGSGNFDPSEAPASFTTNIMGVSLVADQAVATTLIPTEVAGVYNWGPVDVDATFTFDMETTVTITVDGFPPTDFILDEQVVDTITIEGLTGTYSGDEEGTILDISFPPMEIVYAPDPVSPESGVTYWVDVAAAISQLDVLALNDTPMPVPEPSVFVLQAIAILGLGLLRTTRRHKPSV